MFEEKNIKKQRNTITIFDQSLVEINPHQMAISESLAKEDGANMPQKGNRLYWLCALNGGGLVDYPLDLVILPMPSVLGKLSFVFERLCC